ncbi:MAG: homoserine kinase, partial [Pseudomonadota bacterium]
MAVYTDLDAATLGSLIAQFDVGRLISAEPIAEGVSNSNWRVETTGSAAGERFVLTMFERRIEHAELPFFLELLGHLAAKGCPVPRTISTPAGELFLLHRGKAVALIEFLPGIVVERPNEKQVYEVGRTLAGVHRAAADFSLHREQKLGLTAWRSLIEATGTAGLAEIQAELSDLMAEELLFLERSWPIDLPCGITHGDLFPDNVLMSGDEVTGVIDFYFAAHDILAYDLAVTHAAWCFSDDGRHFCTGLSAALLQGYEDVRPLLPAERAALPVLARGAAMRFIASRAFDWIDTAESSTVRRKDPLAFVRRLRWYRQHGA